MLPLRYPERWRGAGMLLLLAVLAAAMLPDAIDKRVIPDFIDSDKVLHCLAFAALATWFSGQYGRRSYWRIAAGLLAFGGLIEICQLLSGYRDAEWADLLADAAGTVLGLCVALIGFGGWSLRLERCLSKQRNDQPE